MCFFTGQAQVIVDTLSKRGKRKIRNQTLQLSGTPDFWDVYIGILFYLAVFTTCTPEALRTM